jgi:NAD(P)-dependent dehydrogenase (short-subunit alcohol dehydrogenase family)
VRFGGVDIVVSNAGYFLVAREAFKLSRAQQSGGSIVFVASKNAVVAGTQASAYSSAKALELHLDRCLAEGGGGSSSTTATARVLHVNVLPEYVEAALHGPR